MRDKLVIKFDDGTEAYHTLKKDWINIEEGHNLVKLYDTTGRTNFVAAYPAGNVISIKWE